jgi:hypothetical protein
MFCALAKYATVMIVGDSLSWEHYVSLAQLLRVRSVYGYMHYSKNLGANVGHAVCGGTSRLVYRRDDDLTSIRHALFENLTHIPQVLVLNRGAHYVKDGQYRRELRLTYQILDGYHINVLRPEKHTDCLHSCCPGKMDVYPQLMLHYLRGDRTAADVESLQSVFHEHQWNINVTTNIKKTSRT